MFATIISIYFPNHVNLIPIDFIGLKIEFLNITKYSIIVTDIQKLVPLHKLNAPRESDGIQQYPDFKKSIKSDFDKYLREYTTISNLETAHFRNRNLSIEQVKPIPEMYSNIESKDKNNDYLEIPLYEFRKLYQSEIPRSPTKEIRTTPRKSTENSKSSQRKTSLHTLV